MVGEIRIYIEGGGDSRSTKDELRRGYSVFLSELRSAARQKRIRWHTVVCGGREAAYDAFVSAISQHPTAFNVLLVDAEAAVTTAPWKHLRQRDGWDSCGTPDKHCHLMVQTMEAWFIADPDAVKDYFGKGVYPSRLPNTANVEAIPKDRLANALDSAAKRTKKKGYEKIRDGAGLLEKIRPDVVRTKAKHCDRLFKTVEKEVR